MERQQTPERAIPETPRAEGVVSVGAETEAQLRSLLRMEAAVQRHALDERRAKAIEAGTHDPKAQQKIGWAEQLQESAKSRIRAAMQQRGAQETETLSDPIVAQMLRDIVETGKIGKNDIPAEFRQVVAEYCAKKGEPEHWWPAALRAAWCLDLGRSLGLTKKPEGIDLLPGTRAFLGGLDYEYGQAKGKSKDIGVEGKAQRGPKQIAARLESKTVMIRESAMGEFEAGLDKWILSPPKQEEARKEHFADVEAVIGVAQRVMETIPSMTQERKSALNGRMQTANASIASRRSGEARIKRM